MKRCLIIISAMVLVVPRTSLAYDSHPPARPLPTPARGDADRVHGETAKFVDPARGSDRNAGGWSQPWKTLQHAVTQLRPGTTLYLRGGRYHERVQASLRGEAKRPITICGFPGEIAIIDGGLPEFYDSPAAAWEPVVGGATGEYRSTRAYPDLKLSPDRTNLLGNFGDSLTPLHGYRFLSDLRSDNHRFHNLEGSKTDAGDGLYCGPGLFLHPETRHIHVRLAPTQQPSIGEANNYRGESDPRKLSLVVAGSGRAPLELRDASHVVVKDLVVCGSRDATLDLIDGCCITLDGVVSYGGSAALRVESTSGLRCLDCAFRGIAAPWLWRWSLKYRSIEARIVSASRWNPTARPNRDFEFVQCEFTDSVDGVFIGNVDGVAVRHCWMDNVSDDGFFLTCRTAYDGSTPGGNFVFEHNRVSRVLTAFAFGVGHGRQRLLNDAGDCQLGKPTRIQHNVFDLREPVLYQQPKSPDEPITTFGRICGDHGSPAWEPIDFVQNMVQMKHSPWRNYYGAGWAKAMGKGARRRIHKNLFLHETGRPGDVLPQKRSADAEVDFEASGNWHWGDPEQATETQESFLKRFRGSSRFTETNWTAGDTYGPPSAAPADVGAGANVAVGMHGRYRLYGDDHSAQESVTTLQPFKDLGCPTPQHRVAIVAGYPAFDAPMLEFAFEQANAKVDIFDRTWLPADRLPEYQCVAFLGSTTRAKMQPSGFSESEHDALERYLRAGGTLLVGRDLVKPLFPGEGQAFLASLIGTAPRRPSMTRSVLQPDHPWLRHVTADEWIQHRAAVPISLGRGDNVIGDRSSSRSILSDTSVGRGRFIYVGWDLSRFLPNGRAASTLEQERAYKEQYQIYANIVQDVLSHH